MNSKISSMVILLILFSIVAFNPRELQCTIGSTAEAAGLSARLDDSDEEESPLEEAMSQIQSGGRSVRRALRKKDVPAALVAIGKAQAGVVAAKGLIPVVAESAQGEERAALLHDYRSRMIAVLEQWVLMEKALLAGKIDVANAVSKKLSELKKSGHEKYDIDD